MYDQIPESTKITVMYQAMQQGLSSLEHLRMYQVFYKTLEKEAKVNPSIKVILEDVKNHRKKLSHYTLYTTIRIDDSQKPKLFDTTHDKTVGSHKIHSGQLPEGTLFVPASLVLQGGVIPNANPTKADIVNVLWKNIATQDTANLYNAELTFGKEGVSLVKEMSCNVFGRDEEMPLETSVVFEGGKHVKGELEMSSIAGLPNPGSTTPSATFARFGAIGLAIMPN